MKKEMNMKKQEFDVTSYNEGIDACIEGISFVDNPYKDGTLCAYSWAMGWTFWNTAGEF
jgi:glycyl-tRNA synthetase alpha subunit